MYCEIMEYDCKRLGYGEETDELICEKCILMHEYAKSLSLLFDCIEIPCAKSSPFEYKIRTGFKSSDFVNEKLKELKFYYLELEKVKNQLMKKITV